MSNGWPCGTSSTRCAASGMIVLGQHVPAGAGYFDNIPTLGCVGHADIL